jgi:glycosyltransferase involved in cell wall biosynthesis
MNDRPVVVFAMEWVPQYRAEFYGRLRAELADRGIEMRLVHGDPPASRKKRNDSEVLDWATYVPNRMWTVKGLELTAQPVLRHLRGADLVVLQQETGLILNYLVMAWSRLPFGALRGPRVALWGHGHNFNPREASGPAERVKQIVTKWADWAFAYTERSAEVFRSIDMNPAHITVVQNSSDIEPLKAGVAAAADPAASTVGDAGQDDPSADVAELVASLRDRNANVGWIVSALDRWKRVPFLIDVLDRCAERIDGFEFIALGAGDQAHLLVEAAETRPWLHPLGARFGADKAIVASAASVTIHPGLAGLHVIETFATGAPMVTADIDYHSHEVSYLNDDNSVMLAADASADDFAVAVERLFVDPAELERLKAGCAQASARYTLDAMVDNFATGIGDALTVHGRRSSRGSP